MNEVAIYWAEYDMTFILKENIGCCAKLYHEDIGDHDVWLNKVADAFYANEMIIIRV